MANKGFLIIISGPSGVGKGSICKALLAKDNNTVYSVSATTRAPRRGEAEGKSYFFISKEEFIRRRDNGDFLEWAKVFENYYGTPAAEINKMLAEGKNIVLEIDTQGAMQIKSACPDGVSFFILPPSYEELTKRITKRGSETNETRQKRLSYARLEMEQANLYDYQLVNEDVDKTAEAILAIVAQKRQKRE